MGPKRSHGGKPAGAARLAFLAGACVAVLAFAAPQTANGLSQFATNLRAGNLNLRPCRRVPAYCGSIVRPLDPAGIVPGTIRIGFTWLPRRNTRARAAGTIVAMEGGPGYPSGASFASYARLFAPLLDRRNLLLVDDRGTGRSGALLCQPLQSALVSTVAAVSRCGRTLGVRADLYGTAIASDDVAAVIRALHARRLTLYGDSYGTFMAQTFAGRHPKGIGAIVLDGAYPAVGADPWLASVAPQMRRAFDLVCRRSAACARLPGSARSRIEALLGFLRSHASGVRPSQLAFVMASAGLDPIAYRELDAAGRAYLSGDRRPLLRLVSDTYRYEEQNGSDVQTFSAALFAASTCDDDPEPYDMTLPPVRRAAQWKRVLDAKERTDPNLEAPFTIAEFLRMPADYAYLDTCVGWPVASKPHPSREPLRSRSQLPAVPVLVLVGDLDTITTPEESAAAASLFAHATLMVVKNTGHVTAIGDTYDCAEAIVRHFVATTRTGSTACAREIPAIRLVASFDRAISARFSVYDSALAAAGDVLARIQAYGVKGGRGLRGGTYRVTASGPSTTVVMHDVAWTTGVPVSGTMRFDGRNGAVQLDARIGARRYVQARWNAYYPRPARVVTTHDGRQRRLSLSAP